MPKLGFGHALAHREGEKIFLSHDGAEKFYPLLKGEQFLFTSPSSGTERALFFGGMDESPFLVELEFDALEGLFEGERGFFEGLKPQIIRHWEKSLGVKAKRQGDFFAISDRQPKSWKEFFQIHKSSKLELEVVEKRSLAGTRHQFSGLAAWNEGCFIGEGTIEAPDHAPLLLKGPHLIRQAV